jgi:hypothetical protein
MVTLIHHAAKCVAHYDQMDLIRGIDYEQKENNYFIYSADINVGFCILV